MKTDGEKQSSHRGLGDTIAEIAKRIGIKKPCRGCEKRQRVLNERFPYKQSHRRGKPGI